MEKRVKKINLNNNVFKEIKKITIYKKRENILNVLFENEKKEVKFVTDEEKAEALASHFEKIHKLTHKSVSVMESIVNETYDMYDTTEPICEFNQNTPADFMNATNNNNNNTNNMSDIFTNSKELSEIIKTRNGKKSSGSDRTSNYMLKKNAKQLRQRLSNSHESHHQHALCTKCMEIGRHHIDTQSQQR